LADRKTFDASGEPTKIIRQSRTAERGRGRGREVTLFSTSVALPASVRFTPKSGGRLVACAAPDNDAPVINAATSKPEDFSLDIFQTPYRIHGVRSLMPAINNLLRKYGAAKVN
jgi:hypothetical protein